MIQFITSVRNYIHTRQRWLCPLAILFIAMIANGVAMCFEDGISNDAVKYRKMIANWITHQDIFLSSENVRTATTISPFFLWTVKCITELFNVEIFTAARSVNFVCGILSPLLFFYLINCFTTKRNFSFFCAIVLACHPSAVYISTILTRDCLYFFLAILTLLCAASGILNKKWWSCAIAGFSFTAAVFTRYEALELFPLFVIFLIFCVCGKKVSWQRGLSSLAIFIAFILIAALVLGWCMGFHADYIEQVLLRYEERFRGFM